VYASLVVRAKLQQLENPREQTRVSYARYVNFDFFISSTVYTMTSTYKTVQFYEQHMSSDPAVSISLKLG
jgi:hypothetical protein